jgi:hypothetical protein
MAIMSTSNGVTRWDSAGRPFGYYAAATPASAETCGPDALAAERWVFRR